jgi:hypothetical protein
MKLIKIHLCAAVLGAVALLSANSAAGVPVAYFPRPTLNLSGTVMVPGPAFGFGSLQKLSFNNKTLIRLLNASPSVQRYITNNVTHSTVSNTIPAGSYFVWDMDQEEVWVTNKNGFSFDVDDPVDFYIDYDEDVLIGSFSLNKSTWAGTEKDVTGVELYFYDGNYNELEGYYGLGTFNWKYGAIASGTQTNQTKSVSVSMSPGSYYAEVSDVSGITTAFTVSGSGSAAGLTPFYEPFYMWW